MKPLLVGESNPYGADPHFALYPEPRGASGDRLCRLIMGLSGGRYMAMFDRVNLCTGKWSAPQARARAREILGSDEHRLVVLLGAKVRDAFWQATETTSPTLDPVTSMEFFTAVKLPRPIVGSLTAVILPHPSGLNREWGKPDAVERARSVLREAGILPAEVAS